MQLHQTKTQQTTSLPAANQHASDLTRPPGFKDNRPLFHLQRKMQQLSRNNPQVQRAVSLQRMINTGSHMADQRQTMASIFGAPIQTKLTINDPGDKYEKEADQVASQVVAQINSPAAESQSVQRMDGMEEEELMAKSLPGIQRMDGMEEEELMMKSLPGIQRMDGPEEEELMMKSLPGIQRMDGMEEEELMAKSLPGIQRMDGPEEEELMMKSLPGIQRMDGPEEEELMMKRLPNLQRDGNGAVAASDDLESSIQQARGGGQSLNDGIRQPMEQAFGADFSGVKIHTDSTSDQLNQSVQAKAFTTGQDVFFRGGEYNPGSKGGQELLAHELTHVIHQNGDKVQKKERK